MVTELSYQSLRCVLEHLEASKSDSTNYTGIGMKMDDNRDLVLSHGRHRIGSLYRPALKMEVVASGSENKIGDSEP